MQQQQLSELIQSVTAQLFNLLQVPVTVSVDVEETEGRKYLMVKVHTDDGEAGELIGHHGSRLQDFSALLNLFLPAEASDYTIVLDINNYRQERTEQVKELALKHIEQAASTSTEVRIDPMPSWERRIVHTMVSERTDVISLSEGEGDYRHVVIKPVSAGDR
jgi:spoIIIJ-associated protein